MTPLRDRFVDKFTLRAFRNPPISSRHELVIALGLIFFISGTGGAFLRYARPTTVVDLVPHWVALFWLFDIIIGGAGLLISIAMRDRINALILEWPSLLYIGSGAALYGIALLKNGTAVAFFSCVTFSIIGVLCVVRAARVALYLRGKGQHE